MNSHIKLEENDPIPEAGIEVFNQLEKWLQERNLAFKYEKVEDLDRLLGDESKSFFITELNFLSRLIRKNLKSLVEEMTLMEKVFHQVIEEK